MNINLELKSAWRIFGLANFTLQLVSAETLCWNLALKLLIATFCWYFQHFIRLWAICLAQPLSRWVLWRRVWPPVWGLYRGAQNGPHSCALLDKLILLLGVEHSRSGCFTAWCQTATKKRIWARQGRRPPKALRSSYLLRRVFLTLGHWTTAWRRIKPSFVNVRRFVYSSMAALHCTLRWEV